MLQPAGDLTRDGDRIVAWCVHVDEAALGDALSVAGDLVQRSSGLRDRPSDFS